MRKVRYGHVWLGYRYSGLFVPVRSWSGDGYLGLGLFNIYFKYTGKLMCTLLKTEIKPDSVAMAHYHKLLQSE